MKYIAAAVAILTMAGCGPSEQQPARESRLRLVVSDTPITLQAGQSLALQLLVIGPGSEQATIASHDLPPFALLQGSLLTLSPSRQYEGDYTTTLIATADSNSASAVLHITVTRPQTAPRIAALMLWATGGDNTGGFCLDLPNCILSGTPVLSLTAFDDEGDPVTFDVELVPGGQPFSGSPTQSVMQNETRPNTWSGIEVRFPGLTVGQSYSLAVRCRDALGAPCTLEPTAVNGWIILGASQGNGQVHDWRFVQGPR